MAEGLPDTPAAPRPLSSEEPLSPQVARLIREMIMSGQAVGHSRLRTEHLAERFGVSATPVREALMSLHGEGLVSFQPGHGFRVAPMTRQDLYDLYDAQAYFAGELTARATVNLTTADFDLLMSMQSELIAAIEHEDDKRANDLEFDIHKLINMAANAPKLQWLLKLTMRYVPFRSWSEVPGWSRAAPEDHLPILRGLIHRSPRAARDAMTAHIRNVAELLADLLADRGVLVDVDGANRATAPDSRTMPVRLTLPGKVSERLPNADRVLDQAPDIVAVEQILITVIYML